MTISDNIADWNIGRSAKGGELFNQGIMSITQAISRCISNFDCNTSLSVTSCCILRKIENYSDFIHVRQVH